MANVVIMTNYAWEQHGIACQMFLQQKRFFIFEITQALLQSNLAWSTFDWKLVKCCWCNVLNGSVAMPAKSLESDSDLLMPSLGANSKSVFWVPGEDTFLNKLFLQTIPCCSLPNLHCQLMFQMPGVLLSCRESLGMWAPVLPPARLASCLDLPGNSRSSSYVGVFVKPYKRTLSPGRGQSRTGGPRVQAFTTQPRQRVTLSTALLSTSTSQWFSFRGKIWYWKPLSPGELCNSTVCHKTQLDCCDFACLASRSSH